MADQKVSILKLTPEMRKKIAADLGLSQVTRVPKEIAIVGISTRGVAGAGKKQHVLTLD